MADRLAIIHEGRLEQIGEPAAMYDHPANAFVMQFLGPTTQLGGEWVRPHDLVVHRDASFGGQRASVERITHLGFEVRVDLSLDHGGACWVQLSRGAAAELHLSPGDRVWGGPVLRHARDTRRPRRTRRSHRRAPDPLTGAAPTRRGRAWRTAATSGIMH